jgi:hypothetical protein
MALNFASTTHHGGGLLTSARARKSLSYGLRGFRSASETILCTCAVPVFRVDDGMLLEEPYTVEMITLPAVHATRLAPARHAETCPAMWQRIRKVLALALLYGYDSIVLGAWGCGAFGNNRGKLRVLSASFRGTCSRGVSLDGIRHCCWSPEQRFLGSFQRVFAGEL